MDAQSWFEQHPVKTWSIDKYDGRENNNELNIELKNQMQDRDTDRTNNLSSNEESYVGDCGGNGRCIDKGIAIKTTRTGMERFERFGYQCT